MNAKKLHLHKETLRALNEIESDKVNAGVPLSWMSRCDDCFTDYCDTQRWGGCKPTMDLCM